MDKSKTSKPALPSIGAQLINNLFGHVIGNMISFDTVRREEVVTISKQIAVMKLKKEVFNFINTHPYAFFEIIVLPGDSMDVENPLVTLKVKNFKFFISEEFLPVYYRLVINETWSGFDLYQKSIDDNWLKIN